MARARVGKEGRATCSTCTSATEFSDEEVHDGFHNSDPFSATTELRRARRPSVTVSPFLTRAKSSLHQLSGARESSRHPRLLSAKDEEMRARGPFRNGRIGTREADGVA